MKTGDCFAIVLSLSRDSSRNTTTRWFINMYCDKKVVTMIPLQKHATREIWPTLSRHEPRPVALVWQDAEMECLWQVWAFHMPVTNTTSQQICILYIGSISWYGTRVCDPIRNFESNHRRVAAWEVILGGPEGRFHHGFFVPPMGPTPSAFAPLNIMIVATTTKACYLQQRLCKHAACSTSVLRHRVVTDLQKVYVRANTPAMYCTTKLEVHTPEISDFEIDTIPFNFDLSIPRHTGTVSLSVTEVLDGAACLLVPRVRYVMSDDGRGIWTFVVKYYHFPAVNIFFTIGAINRWALLLPPTSQRYLTNFCVESWPFFPTFFLLSWGH